MIINTSSVSVFIVSLVVVFFSDAKVVISSESPPSSSHSFYLFETSSANYSWGAHYSGRVIKSDGTVRCFRYNKLPVMNPDKNGFTDVQDFSRIYDEFVSISDVQVGDLLRLLELIKKSKNGPFERENVGFDMGGHGSSAFIYNDDMNKAKQIVLQSSGSWEEKNLAPSASTLLEELEKMSQGRDLGKECKAEWDKVTAG